MIYTLRTTANREDQVLDFISMNAQKKGIEIYSIIHPHGMRGYIFLEAGTRLDAELKAENYLWKMYSLGIYPYFLKFVDNGDKVIDGDEMRRYSNKVLFR